MIHSDIFNITYNLPSLKKKTTIEYVSNPNKQHYAYDTKNSLFYFKLPSETYVYCKVIWEVPKMTARNYIIISIK